MRRYEVILVDVTGREGRREGCYGTGGGKGRGVVEWGQWFKHEIGVENGVSYRERASNK